MWQVKNGALRKIGAELVRSVSPKPEKPLKIKEIPCERSASSASCRAPERAAALPPVTIRQRFP